MASACAFIRETRAMGDGMKLVLLAGDWLVAINA